jgi:dihydroxyacetone kinase-like protein
MWKAGGGKAALGGDLDDVIRVSRKAIDNARSIGVGLSACTIPDVGHPNFTVEDGNMEVGIGHHGEPGIEIAGLETAGEVARRMCDVILPDLPFNSGDQVVLILSGLGSTPVMELYILLNDVEKILTEKGIKIHLSYVGNYFTSLEMAGATLTLMKLDDELKECIELEADSVGLRQFQVKK